MGDIDQPTTLLPGRHAGSTAESRVAAPVPWQQFIRELRTQGFDGRLAKIAVGLSKNNQATLTSDAWLSCKLGMRLTVALEQKIRPNRWGMHAMARQSLTKIEYAGERATRGSAPTITPNFEKLPGDSTEPAQRGAVLTSTIIRLLDCADRALPRNLNEAHRCIEWAMALLIANQDLRGAEGHGPAPKPMRSSLAPWQINRVANFVDANLASTIKVQDLAVVARLSTSYFSRVFRSALGEPPRAYVMRRRIERAQELILLTDKSLSEIALDCGLADQAHLSRLFRRIVGVSPGVWRRLHSDRELVSFVPNRSPSINCLLDF